MAQHPEPGSRWNWRTRARRGAVDRRDRGAAGGRLGGRHQRRSHRERRPAGCDTRARRCGDARRDRQDDHSRPGQPARALPGGTGRDRASVPVAALLRRDHRAQHRQRFARAGRPPARIRRPSRRPPHLHRGNGILVPRRLQRRRPQCPDHRGRGARAGAQPDRTRRALHQDVGQRGRGARPEDSAGDTGGHHRRSGAERRDPRRPHRRRSRRPPTGRGRPAGFPAQHRADLRPRCRRPGGRSRSVARVHPDVPRQRRVLHADPVDRPEPLALRGASGAAGRPGVACRVRHVQPGRARRLGRPRTPGGRWSTLRDSRTARPPSGRCRTS